MTRSLMVLLFVGLAGLAVRQGVAQYLGPTGTAPPTGPSYSDYYNKNLSTYYRPPVSARQYTADTYFYHKPTVSPYLNLTRHSGSGINNYYQYVRPELQRREAASGLSTAMPPGQPVKPVTSGNPYHNQWYGGRQALGLNP